MTRSSSLTDLEYRLFKLFADNDGDDQDAAVEVNSFRGIDFDKWLEIILKVRAMSESLVPRPLLHRSC